LDLGAQGTRPGVPLPKSVPSRRPPLHEGMGFAAAHHTEVAMRLSVLWAAVSLAAQSILGRLPVDVFQAGVMGEMVARFQE
jgi:hypothetical protein